MCVFVVRVDQCCPALSRWSRTCWPMEPVNVVWSVLSSSTRSVLRLYTAHFIQSGHLSKSHVVIDDSAEVEDKLFKSELAIAMNHFFFFFFLRNVLNRFVIQFNSFSCSLNESLGLQSFKKIRYIRTKRTKKSTIKIKQVFIFKASWETSASAVSWNHGAVHAESVFICVCDTFLGLISSVCICYVFYCVFYSAMHFTDLTVIAQGPWSAWIQKLNRNMCLQFAHTRNVYFG